MRSERSLVSLIFKDKTFDFEAVAEDGSSREDARGGDTIVYDSSGVAHGVSKITVEKVTVAVVNHKDHKKLAFDMRKYYDDSAAAKFTVKTVTFEDGYQVTEVWEKCVFSQKPISSSVNGTELGTVTFTYEGTPVRPEEKPITV